MILAQNGRLHVLPVGAVLGDGNEIATEEHAGDAGNAEKAGGERGCGARFRLVAELGRAGLQHHLAGQELQGRRVRRRFGLDEHVRLRPARRFRRPKS